MLNRIVPLHAAPCIHSSALPTSGASNGLLQVPGIQAVLQNTKIWYLPNPDRFKDLNLRSKFIVAKGGTAKRTQSIDATIAILFTRLLSCTKATMGYIILSA